MNAVTPEEKRALAAKLKKEDSNFLEFLTLTSQKFGKLKQVKYEQQQNHGATYPRR